MAADVAVSEAPAADPVEAAVLAQPPPLAAFWAAFRENRAPSSVSRCSASSCWPLWAQA